MKFWNELKIAIIAWLSFYGISRLYYFDSDGKIFCFGLIGFVLYGVIIIIDKYKKTLRRRKKEQQSWYAVSLAVCALMSVMMILMLFFS